MGERGHASIGAGFRVEGKETDENLICELEPLVNV